MRFEWVILGCVTAVSTAASLLTACGSNIDVATGSSDGNGTGGAQTTVSVSGSGGAQTGTGTTTTTTSSSSSGSGNDCVPFCAFVQQCLGFDACKQTGLDCANPTPKAQCTIDCSLQGNPTCQNILSNAQACLAVCMTEGTTSSSSSSGGSDSQCVDCVAGPVGHCNAEVQACAADDTTGCGMWFQCAGGCYQQNPVDPQCFDSCDMQYPGAKPKYDPVYACSCAQCGTQCAAGDPCAHVAGGGP